jgi:hypothetical protein
MNKFELPSVENIHEPKKTKKRGRKPSTKKRIENVITTEIPTKKTDSYQTDSVFLRRLTAAQKRGLSLLFHGVSHSDKTLQNKRQIKHPVDAMRWLLEQINDAVQE